MTPAQPIFPLSARELSWLYLRGRLLRTACDLRASAASDAFDGETLLMIADQLASLAINIPKLPAGNEIYQEPRALSHPSTLIAAQLLQDTPHLAGKATPQSRISKFSCVVKNE